MKTSMQTRLASFVLAVATSAVVLGSTIAGMQLSAGQDFELDLALQTAGVTETVNVEAESPVLDTNSASIGVNVTEREVLELPVNGRNWINLALLAPGSRTVPVAGSREDSEKPLLDRNNNESREFHFHVDGQQVTSEFGTGGQPQIGRAHV